MKNTVLGGGNVALIAHGHFLRSLGAAWVDLPVIDGRKLALHTGTISILGYEHGHPVILGWNIPATDHSNGDDSVNGNAHP